MTATRQIRATKLLVPLRTTAVAALKTLDSELGDDLVRPLSSMTPASPQHVLIPPADRTFERVRMDKAVAGHDIMGRYVSSDSTANYPVRFSDIWGRWTNTGVHGDPTQASAEKGQAIFEAAVTNLIAFVDEWRAWPIAERQDQHTQPVQAKIQW